MPEKTTEIAQHQQQQRVTRRDPLWAGNPFRLLEHFANEIDTVFDDFGFGRSGIAPRLGRGVMRSPFRGTDVWAPEVEVYQQNNELVVRADLPGLKKDDIKVDVTEHEITISGERRQEHETERGGVYRTERSYGSFYRSIALPEGAISDQAKATFNNGVLEIKLPAPPEQVTRGRRLEIKEGAEAKK